MKDDEDTNRILTCEEMRQLTGYKITTKQKQTLERNGIFFIERPDGSVTTTWYHINHPAGLHTRNDPACEPHFERI